MTDSRTFTLLIALGIAIGAPFFYLTGGIASDPIHSDALYQALKLASVFIFVKLVFSSRREKAQETKAKNELEATQMIAKAMAHEFKRPDGSLGPYKKEVQETHQKLVSLYKDLETKKLLTIPRINEEKLNRLPKFLKLMDISTGRNAKMIEMVLTQLRPSGSKAEHTNVSIQNCIDIALNQYQHPDHLKRFVLVDASNDIKLMCYQAEIVHVFLNLIENAFYALEVTENKDAYVKVWVDPKTNTAHVKDTAMGIPKAILPHIFDSHYTTKEHGSGIGLAFCKRILQELGGDIRCLSKEGSFTEFILYWPKAKRTTA